MIFKKKPFFKNLLGLSLTTGIVPLAIACSQGATTPTEAEQLNQELKKLPASFQLKADQVLSTQQFKEIFTSDNVANHLSLFNEAIAGVDNDGNILNTNALNFTLEGISVNVSKVTASNTEASVNISFGFRSAKDDKVLNVTGFLTQEKAVNQQAVNLEKARIEDNSKASKELATNVVLPSDATSINTLEKLNNLLKTDHAFDNGLTITVSSQVAANDASNVGTPQDVVVTVSGFRT